MSINFFRAKKHFILTADKFGEYNIEIYTDDFDELITKKDELLRGNICYIDVFEVKEDNNSLIFKRECYENNELIDVEEKELQLFFYGVDHNNKQHLFLDREKVISFAKEIVGIEVPQVMVIESTEIISQFDRVKRVFEVWVNDEMIAKLNDKKEALDLANKKQTMKMIPITVTKRGLWEVYLDNKKIKEFVIYNELMKFVKYLRTRTNGIIETREKLQTIQGTKKYEFDTRKEWSSTNN